MIDVLVTLASGSGSTEFVRDLLVVLSAAALVSIFLKRLRLAAIPGYLLVGALIGALGLVTHDADSSGPDSTVQQIADLAIVLLMFTIGMHLDVEHIRTGMVHIVLVGVGSTLGVIALLWGVGMLFGLAAPVALVIAMGLAMSSTAVVLGILQSRRELHAIHGRLCVGVSLVQDLLSVGVLALMPLIAVWATGKVAGPASGIVESVSTLPKWAQLLSDSAVAIGGIGLMLAFGRYVLPRFLREAGRGGNVEAMLVVSAASALASAVVTAALGFGPALGAFLAGFLLSATPFRHQLAGQLAPMRDLFMAIFFTAIGAKIDPWVVLNNWWIIAIGVVVLVSIKAGVIGFAAWAGGATGPVAGLSAVMLCQAGEFSLVVFEGGQRQGVLTDEVQSVAIAICVVSLILAEPLVGQVRNALGQLARIRPAAWIAHSALRGEIGHGAGDRSAQDAQPAATEQGWAGVRITPGTAGPDSVTVAPPQRPLRVIIAGFGIVGRNLAEHFAVHDISFVVVEMNPATVEKQIKLGKKAVFGDISNPDVLRSAGIETADAIMLTIPDDDVTLRSCRIIRELRPDIFIAARTSYLSRAIAATELGADHVTVEEVVTATDMATKVVAQLAKRRKKPTTPHL